MKIEAEKVSGRLEIIIRRDLGVELDRNKYYEIDMLKENIIPVFLECDSRFENGEEYYAYNISSMISLEDYSKMTPLRYEELCILIKSLTDSRNAIDEFLLSPDGVVIEPDYIYYDKSKYLIRFCFYPWNTFDIHNSYTRLTEFLLLAVDYDDEKAVKLAYEIYAAVLNKDYELEKYIDYNDLFIGATVDNKIKYEKEKQNNPNVEYMIADSNHEIVKEKTYEKTDMSPIEYREKQRPKHFSAFSVFCIVLLIVISILFAVIYCINRDIVINYLQNMRVMTGLILIISFLIYFPLMNIVDIKCYLVTNKQL